MDHTRIRVSLVPRLSPRANEKLEATESWAGPGNEAILE